MRRLAVPVLAVLGAVATTARLRADDPPPLPSPVAPNLEVRLAPTRGVSALGRLEPKDGVRRVAGPSLPVAVVQELFVDRGDLVQKGQLLATLDTAELQGAVVQEKTAELANARREYDRSLELSRSQVESISRRDEWRTKVAVLEAQLARAEAERRLTQVRAPIEGRVLDVHARPGERVGSDGILELGATQAMYAIAEVYETDVSRVAVGQRARVTSPVFAKDLTGVVDKVRPKIQKNDALGTDPAARKDARVVEVEIELDDSAPVAGLTHVQVEVTLLPTQP
jgi:HlyD family secretion protein